MLAGQEPITLVRHVRQGGEDLYLCTPLQGSWYDRRGVSLVTEGLRPGRVLRCRFPLAGQTQAGREALAQVRPGDKLLRGTLSSCAGAGFAALGRTHGAVTVRSVADNTRRALPHWAVEGVD